VGLALVLGITRQIGFRTDRQTPVEQASPLRDAVVDFAQIVLQSFVASYTILLLIGIVDVSTSPNLVVRLGLVELVPLGFGAALANRLFGSTDQGEAEKEVRFPENVAVFSVGALFVASTIAPTREMELVAAHMGWPRHVLLVALTLVLVYLVLYELDFRGQGGRVRDRWHLQAGTVFVVFAVGASVSFLLLLAFGHFVGATVALAYQETVVLAFPASLGAAAAQVIL